MGFWHKDCPEAEKHTPKSHGNEVHTSNFYKEGDSPDFAGLKIGSLSGILKAIAGVIGLAVPAVDYQTVQSNRFYSVATDFESSGALLNPPWAAGALSSGTATMGTVISPDHPGNVNLNSAAASANSGYYFMFANTKCIMLGGNEVTEFVFKFISGVACNYKKVRLGFSDSITKDEPSLAGVWIDITGLNATTLRVSGKTNYAGAVSTTPSTYTLSAGSFYRAKIVTNSDLTKVDFYLYSESGTELWHDSLTDNIPPDEGVSHGVLAYNTAGGYLINIITMDFMNFYADRTLIR